MAARILTSFAQLDVLFCSASLFVVICLCVALAIVYHNIITGPELLLLLVVVVLLLVEPPTAAALARRELSCKGCVGVGLLLWFSDCCCSKLT